MKPYQKSDYTSKEEKEEEAVAEPGDVGVDVDVEELDVYACPVCGKEFEKEVSVRMHAIRSHGEYPE